MQILISATVYLLLLYGYYKRVLMHVYMMSKKNLIIIIHFFDYCYNVISYFYAEMWRFYQIYILQIFIEEAAIPARIQKKMR